MATIFNKYYDYVISRIDTFTNDSDIKQEILMKFWQASGHISGDYEDAQIYSWINTFVHDRYVDVYRKIVEIDEIEYKDDIYLNQKKEYKTEYNLIEKYMKKLNKVSRKVIELTLESKETHEIAEELNMRQKDVSTLKHAAEILLRHEIKTGETNENRIAKS